MKSKASFTHSGYYMLQFDEFLKVNFRNRMLVENAISPWVQSWERVFKDCPHGEIRHCHILLK